MRVSQGGTKMHCPKCQAVRVCAAIPTTDCGKPSGQRWYDGAHTDVRWFRRGRRCQRCQSKFLTAEVNEDCLDELFELRNELANIKSMAEEYVKQATAAAGSLERLTKSLSVLRALKVYQDADYWETRPLSDLELSVRATNCLEAEGITTVGVLCTKSDTELLEVRNFGETTLKEVRQKLAERGLQLSAN